MNRPWIRVAAVLVLIVAVVGLLISRRSSQESPSGAGAEPGRTFISDSLGVRLRVPDDPKWSLRREDAPRSDGQVAIAVHESERASVRLYVLPSTPAHSLDEVVAARKKMLGEVFGPADFDHIIARVVKDEKRDVGGRIYHQYQGVSQPIEVPGQDTGVVTFMWLITKTPLRSYEAIGLLRYPVPTPDDVRAETTDLVKDLAYILQSFEIR